MTRFNETAQRTISNVEKKSTGWVVTFVNGSCQLIKKSQKKGTTTLSAGKIIESCRSRCSGPDEKGKCTWRPRGPRADNVPNVVCNEQFVYVKTPVRYGKPTPKFDRCVQKLSYKIKSFRTLKRRLLTEPEKWKIVFENNTTKTILKSDQLGRNGLKHGYYLVPCGEECLNRSGTCIHCYGDRRNTKCEQQFYFCRKYLSRHKHDKQK